MQRLRTTRTSKVHTDDLCSVFVNKQSFNYPTTEFRVANQLPYACQTQAFDFRFVNFARPL
jgi:hypothetical protein